MSELFDPTAYMDTAQRALDMMDERQQLVDWWEEQKPFVAKLEPAQAADLRAAWIKRGRAVVHATKILDRTKVPA